MDEKIRELLRSYNVLSTIPTTGSFNVVTELRNLEETPYFSGKPELISQMIMARSNEDIDALKTIIDGAIKEAEDVGKIDIDAIEKEKGFKSNVFKYSKNAFGDNNQIEQLYTKKDKNVYQLSSIIFIITSLLPILPSGSFLSTFTSGIFWLNFSIMISYVKSKS